MAENLPDDLTLDTVLMVTDENRMVMNSGAFTVTELFSAIERLLLRATDKATEASARSLISEAGVQVKALVPGEQWKSGRIMLALEFVPDDSSPTQD